MLKLTTDKHKASSGLSAAAELLVFIGRPAHCAACHAGTAFVQCFFAAQGRHITPDKRL